MYNMSLTKIITIIILSILCCSSILSAKEPDILVLMYGSGKVERYDISSGKHIGTFIRGLSSPNAMLLGSDDRLYISTGVPGGHGTVVRYDLHTGRKVDTFIDIPSGQQGHLARATGMAWYDGDLLVASQGDGKVKRFDGKTGAWKADVANATPGSLTQIAVNDNKLYMTDFNDYALRVSDMTDGTSLSKIWIQKKANAPWGLAFNNANQAFRSTSANRILRFDGNTDIEWAGSDGGLNTPVWLSIGPDGLLYAANLNGQNISVWNSDKPNSNAPIRIIGGPEMQSPISIVFSSVDNESPVQIGNFVEKPSNTGRNWKPNGTAIYNLRILKSTAAITDFGIDTEGGDRAKLNLLNEFMSLRFILKDGTVIDSSDLPALGAFNKNAVRYEFNPIAGIVAGWKIWLDRQNLKMDFSLSGADTAKVARVELFMPFSPGAMGTNILAEEWGEKGAVKAPLIINALDMGQLRLAGVDGNKKLDCVFTGSRQHKRTDLIVEVLNPSTLHRTIIFEPARLVKPDTKISDTQWARVRRGLLGLIHITPYYPANEDNSSWLGSPGGITGNNVISDPVIWIEICSGLQVWVVSLQ